MKKIIIKLNIYVYIDYLIWLKNAVGYIHEIETLIYCCWQFENKTTFGSRSISLVISVFITKVNDKIPLTLILPQSDSPLSSLLPDYESLTPSS